MKFRDTRDYWVPVISVTKDSVTLDPCIWVQRYFLFLRQNRNSASFLLRRYTSPQAVYLLRRLFYKSHLSLILSRLLSKPAPLRWLRFGIPPCGRLCFGLSASFCQHIPCENTIRGSDVNGVFTRAEQVNETPYVSMTEIAEAKKSSSPGYPMQIWLRRTPQSNTYGYGRKSIIPDFKRPSAMR